MHWSCRSGGGSASSSGGQCGICMAGASTTNVISATSDRARGPWRFLTAWCSPPVFVSGEHAARAFGRWPQGVENGRERQRPSRRGPKRNKTACRHGRHGTWYMVHGTGQAAVGEKYTLRRLVPLSSRRTAKYRRGGSWKVVCLRLPGRHRGSTKRTRLSGGHRLTVRRQPTELRQALPLHGQTPGGAPAYAARPRQPR